MITDLIPTLIFIVGTGLVTYLVTTSRISPTQRVIFERLIAVAVKLAEVTFPMSESGIQKKAFVYKYLASLKVDLTRFDLEKMIEDTVKALYPPKETE